MSGFPRAERPARGDVGQRLLRGYYLATPLFGLLALGGFGVRVPLQQGAGLYYLACLGLALLVWRRPDWAPLIGLAESSVNVGLVLLGFWRAVLGLPAALEGGETPSLGLSLVVNFLLAGGFAVLAFQLQLRRLRQHA